MARQPRATPTSVIIIILGVIAVAAVGSHFAAMNRDWYEGLHKPSFQPPNYVFGIVWAVLFILFAASLILIWDAKPPTALTYAIMAMAVMNGILNIAWSALFFGHRLIVPAIFDAALLCLTVIFIMIAAWPISRLGSLLLLPYALWTAFATYLTAAIRQLNP